LPDVAGKLHRTENPLHRRRHCKPLHPPQYQQATGQPEALPWNFSIPKASGAQQRSAAMPLYWLCYRRNNSISVVIEPGTSLTRQDALRPLPDWIKVSSLKATSLIQSGKTGPIHMAACGAVSRDYVFDGPEL